MWEAFKKLWRNQNPKPPWINNGKTEEHPSMGRKEGETKDWCHMSIEEGWTNSSFREFDGPLSLDECRTCKTPPEIQRASCALGETPSQTKNDTEEYSRSKVLERLRWQRQSSWTPSQSFVVWLEKQVTLFQRTLRSKWLNLTDCCDCQTKNVLKFSIRIPPRQRPKGWNSVDDLVVLLERSLYGHPIAGLLWERKVEEAILWKEMEKKYQHGSVSMCKKSSDYSFRFMSMT